MPLSCHSTGGWRALAARRDPARRLGPTGRCCWSERGRKNDPTDARTIAVVAVRTRGLRQVQPEDEMVALKMLSDRRRELVRSRGQTLNRLHQLLAELKPASAAPHLTADMVLQRPVEPGEYTAKLFLAACERTGIRQSMARPGSALDNAVIES